MSSSIKLGERSPTFHPKGWGQEIWLANNSMYCGKILEINKDSFFSFHFHAEKNETFYVLEGKILLEIIDPKSADVIPTVLDVGGAYDIPAFNTHRITALENSRIIEISTHHDELDSYRVSKGNSQGATK